MVGCKAEEFAGPGFSERWQHFLAQNIITRYRHKSGAIHDALVSCSRIEIGGEALVLGTMQDLPDLSPLPPR
jgi:hypothetical protein